MLKAVGITVIIAVSFCAAFMNSARYRRRIAVNEAMLDFISYIRARILFFHDPLFDIYSDYRNEELEKTGFLAEITDVGFEKCLINCGINRYFCKNTAVKLADFSKRLGRTGVDEQIANCDLCIALLTDDLEVMRRELPDRSRMTSSLCVIAGLGAVLLII